MNYVIALITMIIDYLDAGHFESINLRDHAYRLVTMIIDYFIVEDAVSSIDLRDHADIDR